MSLLRIKDAAKYVRTSKASKVLLAVLQSAARIFNFTEERHNRVNRYVAVLNAYRRGMPIAEIEKSFGCTKRTIYDYVEKADVPRRSFVPLDVKAAVLRDYQNKIPVAKIAALHGVSARYVQTVAREAGLRRNRTKALK